MNTAQRNQLRHVDRALLALVEERARLLTEIARDDPGRAPSVDDMLRRHGELVSADDVRSFFAAVHAACTSFGRLEEPS